MALVVDRLPKQAADDAALLEELVDLINHAYTGAERGLWVAGAPERTDAAETLAAVLAGETLIARLDDTMVGTIRTQSLEGGEGYSLGTLAVDSSAAGRGVGSALATRVELDAAAAGATKVRLEVLIATPPHPHLERLAEWYFRRGYREVRRMALGHVLPKEAAFLLRPCDLSVMEKPLPAHARDRSPGGQRR